MKKRPLVYTIGLILFLISPAIAQDRVDYTGYPPDIKRILERDRLIVAVYDRDSPPFFFRASSGKLVGYDIALARGMAAELGVEVIFDRSARTFDQIVDLVAGKKVDLAISDISVTLDRAERVLFSDPYLILHPTLIVNRVTAEDYSFPVPDPLEEIRFTAEKIGVEKGTAYVGYAERIFKKAGIVEYDDWQSGMEALLRGGLIAVLRDEIDVKNYLLDNPESAIHLKTIVLEDIEDYISVAVPAESYHLLDWINLYLEQKRAIRTADELLKEYADYY